MDLPPVSPEEALPRLRALGFDEPDAALLADHFLEAERRGKRGHGLARIDWLERLPDLDPSARPRRLVREPCYERWSGDGAVGYLTLAAVCEAQIWGAPDRARLVVAADCFPTGMPRPRPPGLVILKAGLRSSERTRSQSRSRARTDGRSSRTSRWGR